MIITLAGDQHYIEYIGDKSGFMNFTTRSFYYIDSLDINFSNHLPPEVLTGEIANAKISQHRRGSYIFSIPASNRTMFMMKMDSIQGYTQWRRNMQR